MKKRKVIYLIGALANEKIPAIANELEKEGFETFADWFAPGPDADTYWRKYSKARGWTYKQALKSYAATHIFEFDKFHIDRSDIGVLIMPSGRSGHLEAGYMVGQGKPVFILFDGEPEKWDVMSQFATEVCFNMDELKAELAKVK
jgi:nucleoside 2-deoxyribosyltransferase